MYINLPCSSCGEPLVVSFAQLCDYWREGYNQICDRHKQEAKVTVDVQCHCGNKDVYNSPMFQYIFQLVFNELIKDKS